MALSDLDIESHSVCDIGLVIYTNRSWKLLTRSKYPYFTNTNPH